MVEVSLTVGKLDASLALLLTKDHHLIEFPTILLPNGVKAGSIVKIKCEQDLETETIEAENFQKIQDEILNTFGKSLPKAPNLKIKNITQTSCVLEWESLDLGTSNLKNLILYKDGKKLGSIPQPLTNKTTKLSGLPIDKTFSFQIKLDTTAGVYSSEIIEVTTHKMTDLSGITVCLGDLSPNDTFTKKDIEDTIKNIGAKPCQQKIQVDTTHFLCTRENKTNPEYMKAQDMNIPIIRPEWLKACERERRIVGVTAFYLKECVLPDIFAKNYWNKSPREDQKDLPNAPTETNNNSGQASDQTGVSNIDSQSEVETAQPDTEITDSNTETVQPGIEIAQPDSEIVQPDSEQPANSINEETNAEGSGSVQMGEQATEIDEYAKSEINNVCSENSIQSNSEKPFETLIESKLAAKQPSEPSIAPATMQADRVEEEDVGDKANDIEGDLSNPSKFDEVDIIDSKLESTDNIELVEAKYNKEYNNADSIPRVDLGDASNEEHKEEPSIKKVDVCKVSIQPPQQVSSQSALVEPVEEKQVEAVEGKADEEEEGEESEVENEEEPDQVDDNGNKQPHSTPKSKKKKKKNNKKK
jgi:hypothetical protein